MHCFLIQDATTSESNKKKSQAFAHALVQTLPTSLLKNFMGSDSQYYDTHGIKMFQKFKNKILNNDDTIEHFHQLLSPKMSPKETPMDYKINIERVYTTVKAWGMPIDHRLVIKAAANGIDSIRYKSILEAIATGVDTVASLD